MDRIQGAHWISLPFHIPPNLVGRPRRELRRFKTDAPSKEMEELSLQEPKQSKSKVEESEKLKTRQH